MEKMTGKKRRNDDFGDFSGKNEATALR